MTDNHKNSRMAEVLFPDMADNPAGDPAYYEAKYPQRDLPQGAAITRLGPSPTGFIHLGNLYTAFMNKKLAEETGGVCLLRIEDTDNKREVPGAVESLISSLHYFGVDFDEGVMYDATTGDIYEKGGYGPYYQSARKSVYHAFARKLIIEGLAYPCFLTEAEIDDIRSEQESTKAMTGIYGAYAKYREITPEEAASRIASGSDYVVRFKAPYVDGDAFSGTQLETDAGVQDALEITDGIRGKISIPPQMIDVVLLKSNGIPTYHFAHVIDDHFMRTTHVIRGEEWLPSLPIHVALFKALNFELPVYCHSTVLMKMDDGKKRKLSKRKDPELSLEYYRKEGYHPRAILEYLLTVINSNFEEWRIANPDAAIDEFEMTTQKMGVSGILFDLEKLQDVSKEVLAKIPAAELAAFLIDWAERNLPIAAAALAADPARLSAILDIGRSGDKPRKDLSYAKQVWDFVSFFYDDFFLIRDAYPENVPAHDISVLLSDYATGLSLEDDREIWFGKIRDLAAKRGYAAKPKDYKKAPNQYKGHVGDVSTVIRIAVVGRATSPDLYEIQQILGAEKVRERIQCAIDLAYCSVN